MPPAAVAWTQRGRWPADLGCCCCFCAFFVKLVEPPRAELDGRVDAKDVAATEPDIGEVALLNAEECEPVERAAGSEVQDGDETLEAVRTNGDDASQATVFLVCGFARGD